MQAVYGDKCIDVSTVSWVWQFKQEDAREESLCDKARWGRPVTATDESHQERIEEMICIEIGGDYVEKWLCTVVIKGEVRLFFLFHLNIYLPSLFILPEAKLFSPPT